ncbi:uncharacterized protein [Oryza sativa Japonica Group]|jgi:hypothetical protein|uniref:Os02g0804400 protein n=5 Tax=Oryza TaxID=4527 RepID=Q6K851_ORYSJ|nr:uncharacterized protein LOC4331057 [Oryza sativa Japonica Group]XP_052143467.1 uncharacterized protein LOC127762962 [Oryza glaberrima]EAY87914.1 hypothetical protein OsI_09336 [Oryza sativa Indica Group]KAB8089387.1 hypothetical protein EE612_014309 [Oryza sativa]EAZ24990.1 hypothetical protein OsJ_08770 [Oryza sativa Japonica Group]KAF2947502.1 hypothetical protein DAI22_02g373100 [Oryza sativa Japonica Group]BAD19416.1 unknown protein [Oryza sativa Japonica Group]|eukprot:NP_001048433.1 Os02g0804400 [Oryza sativa Japonica Group]
MAIACALSVAAPSLTGKTNSNPPPRRSFQQQWRERRRRGVAARFSGKSADVDAEADSGRIEDDSSYLWKLGLGSVGGAAAIKYGSILLPDITRPNIVVALLMVSIPVAVAVLLLLKVSSRDD